MVRQTKTGTRSRNEWKDDFCSEKTIWRFIKNRKANAKMVVIYQLLKYGGQINPLTTINKPDQKYQ